MAGLVPAIHVLLAEAQKTWMPATSAGMTVEGWFNHIETCPKTAWKPPGPGIEDHG
jgi:hypothetical protein